MSGHSKNQFLHAEELNIKSRQLCLGLKLCLILNLDFDTPNERHTAMEKRYIPLQHKPYGNRVTLREQNLSSKCCQLLKLLIYILGRGLDLSIQTRICRSKGCIIITCQSCSIQVKKKSALLPLLSKCAQTHVAQVRVQPGSNHSQSLMDGNFAAL